MAEAIAVDEDTYTEAISFIIERDFFPSQAKVKALQRLAEAERSGLPDQVKFAARAIRNINEPNLGPSGTSVHSRFYTLLSVSHYPVLFPFSR